VKWQLAEAENRLNEVVNRALEEGPQRIAWGGEVVVVISESDYDRAVGKKPKFYDYLFSANLEGLDLERDSSSQRDTGALIIDPW
jgi:prevent-host-death family protein